MKTLSAKLTYIALLILITLSQSLQAQEFQTIYGRKANVSVLKKLLVTKSLPEAVRLMQKNQVQIFKVDSGISSTGEKNFAFLPEVPSNLREVLAEQIADTKGEGARFVSWNEISPMARNVLLVSERSKPTTLFHEFSHHLFEIQNRADTIAISEEQKKLESFLRIYNRRVSAALLGDDALGTREWRENFDSYIEEYSKTFDSAQGQLFAEEVAIETGLLKLMLEVKSPYFNLDRAKEGILMYSEKIIILQAQNNLNGVLGFMDKIKTTEKDPGSGGSAEEETKREAYYAPIVKRLNFYQDVRITAMQEQVNEAKKILTALEKIN